MRSLTRREALAAAAAAGASGFALARLLSDEDTPGSAPPPAPPATMRFGYNDWWYEHALQAQLARDGGSTTARFPIGWRTLEPAAGQFDEVALDSLDQTIEALSANGQAVILNPYVSPAWAGATYPDQPQAGEEPVAAAVHAPEADDQWEEFLVFLLERYADREIAALEVWNEPNLLVFGAVPDRRLVDLINRAASALERTGLAETVPLVSGGLFCGGDGRWMEYLQTLHDQAHPSCALGVHPHDIGPDPGEATRRAIADFDAARAITAGDRPLWVTEWGFPSVKAGTDAWTEQAQMEALAQTYDHFRLNGAACAICHTLFWFDPDPPTDPHPGDEDAYRGFSTLRMDGAPKPAYYALKERSAPAP